MLFPKRNSMCKFNKLIKLPIMATLLCLATQVYSQITVDTSIDENPTTNGSCTLREAIINANDDASTQPDCQPGIGPLDEIEFDPAVETINLIGPLDISDSIIIRGNETRTTLIGPGDSRLIASPDPVRIELNFLSLQNGFTEDEGRFPIECVRSSGEGGAVCVTGTLVLAEVEIVDSQTTGDFARGGAVAAGTLLLSNSTIRENETSGVGAGGGGLYASDSGGTANFITNSRIVENSTRANNSPGGGLLSFGSLSIENTSILNNSTAGEESSGGGISAGSDVNIRTSTLANNVVEGSSAFGGGANISGSIDTLNSTFSGNLALDSDTGRGGAVYLVGEGAFRNSTIFNNFSEAGAGGIQFDVLSDDGLEFSSTILAGNTGPDGNLQAVDGNVVDAVNTLFGDEMSELTGSSIDNVFSDDPQLEPLEDNDCAQRTGISPTTGGIVPRNCALTHLLMPASLAYDNGNNNFAQAFDQRSVGFLRTLGPQTDIGAIEMPERVIEAVPVPVFDWPGIGLLIILIGIATIRFKALF